MPFLEQDLGISSRINAYSDIDIGFRANPVTGDVARKKDAEAIKQACINILMTTRGEKPFRPNFGGNVRKYLFANITPPLLVFLQQEVESALQNFEPRIKVRNVRIFDRSEQNTLEFYIEVLITSPQRQVMDVQFTVERLR